MISVKKVEKEATSNDMMIFVLREIDYSGSITR